MNDELREGYRRAVTLSVLVLAHVFILVAIEEFLRLYAPLSHPLMDKENMVRIVRYVFLGLAIVDFFMIRLIRDISIKGARKQGYTGEKLINHLVSINLVKDALCGSVAIYGLVLFYLGGHSSDFYTFFIASLVLFGINFPKYGEWEEQKRFVEMSIEYRREEAGSS